MRPPHEMGKALGPGLSHWAPTEFDSSVVEERTPRFDTIIQLMHQLPKPNTLMAA